MSGLPSALQNINRNAVISVQTVEDDEDLNHASNCALEVDIDPTGDLVLEICDQSGRLGASYRVRSTVLTHSSQFFRSLLDPNKFHEGKLVHKQWDRLQSEEDGNVRWADIKRSSLPTVRIDDIGLSLSDNSTTQLSIRSLLQIMHQAESTLPKITPKFIASVLIVADRLDCLERVKVWYQGNKKIEKRLELKVNSTASLSKAFTRIEESERCRQMVFSGWHLRRANIISYFSSPLIVNAPCDIHQGSEELESAVWWDLPGGLEGTVLENFDKLFHVRADVLQDEISYRRVLILETIESLLLSVLHPYMPSSSKDKAQQCKLGYGSSWQCDLFQLGQATQYLTQKGLFTFQSLIQDDPRLPSKWNEKLHIQSVFDVLQAFPSYQIDSNHQHCGIRSRLLPKLRYLRDLVALESRICGNCWLSGNNFHDWATQFHVNGDKVTPRTWMFSSVRSKSVPSPSSAVGDHTWHLDAAVLFASQSRDWTND